MEAITLPAEIEAKCLRLMRHLGLNYGALDFILNKEGEYVFVEINELPDSICGLSSALNYKFRKRSRRS